MSNSINPSFLRYHPFYISDSDEGGYGQKSQVKQRRQTVYAGVAYEDDDYPRPTAAGRYCEWQHLAVDKSLETETFEDYKKTLKLECENGEPAVLNWTVSMDTPDLVYYQVCMFLITAELVLTFIFLTVLHAQQLRLENPRCHIRYNIALQ